MRARQSFSHFKKLELIHAHPDFPGAARIVSQLNDKGFSTVLAGGCVRDALLGVAPKDLDLATAAPPEQVEEIFTHTLAVGKAFGTIVVIESGVSFEVTTFRKDGAYLDGRHPTAVEFSDMNEDAKRRDFTVNALFYNPLTNELIDFVEGLKDLERGLLRTVGSALERFGEDRLRMLRAARFTAQLGFSLEAETLNAMSQLHAEIQVVSVERIFNEMKRLLGARKVVDGISILRTSRLHEVVWPEIETLNLERLYDFVPFLNWENAFAAISLLAGADAGEPRLRAWKTSRENIQNVAKQVASCKALMNPASSRADRARALGGEHFAEALHLTAGFLPDNVGIIQGWIAEFLSMTGGSGTLPKPIVNGQDLLQAGLLPGEEMGLLLKAIYEDQLEGRLTPESKAEVIAKLKGY